VSDRPLVLVVEDDLDNLESIVDLLREEGYDAIGARTGREATDLLRTARPCLMIVDYLLPDTTGTDLVRQLRADSPDTRIPVVFLTAISETIQSDEPVVKKPITLADLLNVLTQYCGPAPAPG
jgi:two-component system phosphate regulon response regulator PhoB